MPASMPTSRPNDILSALNSQRDAIDKLTMAVQDMRLEMSTHNAKQIGLEATVQKHEIALYGASGQRGYLQRFDAVEERVQRMLGSIERGLWVVATALLGGLGLWIWEVLKAGATK